MKLIVGLGNPGQEYAGTRHNAGFMAVDRVARRLCPGGAAVRQRFGGEAVEVSRGAEKVMLLKPMRFMNCSGAAVAEAAGFYKISVVEDLLVIVDDYALPLGTIRIRAEGSSGGHNGLADVERALGTTVYPRLRIGVDGPPANYEDPADWVLSKFTAADAKALEPALDKAAEAVEVFLARGTTAAMNKYNARPKEPQAEKPGAPAPKPAAGGE